MQELLLPALLLWGFFAGFMGGLLGIGGGLIFVLVIPEAAAQLGVLPENLVSVTIANSLACTFFTTFAAGIRRFSSDELVRKASLWMGISSTIVSVLVLRYLVNPGFLSPFYFHYFFLSVLVFLMIRLFFRWRKKDAEVMERPQESVPAMLLTGVFSGVVSPLSGLGGGIVVVPVLHAILHFPISKAQAVSLGVIAISTLISSVFNLFETIQLPTGVPAFGLLLLPVMLSLAPTAMLGSLAGSALSRKLPTRWSSGILMLFLLFVLLKKVLNPL